MRKKPEFLLQSVGFFDFVQGKHKPPNLSNCETDSTKNVEVFTGRKKKL